MTARVTAPDVPVYLMGARRLHLRRARARHGLGDAAKAIAAGSQAAGSITTSLITSSATSAGAGGASGIAAFAGPIGVGIAVVGSIIAGLWAAHEKRAANAKNENAAVNSAMQAFDGSIRAIFDAANSSDPAKYIDANTAIQALEQTRESYWSGLTPYMNTGAGDADASHGGNCEPLYAKGGAAGGAGYCDKECTAGCCVGCSVVEFAIRDAKAVFQQGGGTVNVPKVYPSKYGVVSRESYTLTYQPKPPALSSGLDSLTQALTGNTSKGGGSSFLLPALVIGLGWLLLR